MKVSCPSCGAAYTVDSAKIPGKGGRLTCPACGTQWSIFRPDGGMTATRPSKSFAPLDAAEPPMPPPITAVPAPTAAAAAPHVSCPKCGHRFVTGARAPRPKRAAGGRQKTILLVEDQAYFSEVAREALGEGYRTISVGTKEEALKQIRSDPPQLLILDLSLARGQDGRDLLRELPGKQFPILIFTAQDETDLYGDPWQELKALGADGIVLKTMNVGEELRQKVTELLESD